MFLKRTMKVVFLCVEGRINWTYHAAFSQEAVQPVMGVRHLYIAGSEGASAPDL